VTLSEADRKWREQRRAQGATRKPRRGGSKRFLPMNATADGGWIALLTPRELRVWVAIYRFADKCNRARLSHGTIARLTGMRREHAARTTAQLERRGLLRVLERGRKVYESGKRTANVYEILAPPPNANGATSGTIEEPE
jgi:hypothetical protein